jgi:protein-disulfide isomerase
VFRKKYFSLNLFSTFATTLSLVVLTACTDQAKANKPNFVHKDAPSPEAVAKINGEVITKDTLIGANKLDFFELEKREYDLKMDQLNKLLEDKIIGAEAKKANMSQEDFINKKIYGGPIKISQKEFDEFVESKHIPKSQINDQIKERIFAYLETMKKQDLRTAFVAKQTKGNPVEVYFKKPKMQVQVDVGQAPVYGKADAPVTIVEFSDFQCPFCSRGAEIVTQIKKKYSNKVRIAFKQFPLPMHKDARPAAEASMCVNEQSSDKFWKFHDLAFKNQDKLDKASLDKYAKDSGADMKKFEECVTAKKYADYVTKDMAYGESIGVKSTPTFFVNGQLVSGAVPIEQFSEIIDEELAEKKK